jgi:hypothetical protein
MKDYKRIKGTRVLGLIEEAIYLNQKMKNCYFWSSPSGAGQRRSYEKYNSLNFIFSFQGRVYEVSMETICSCKNVYFKQAIIVDGQSKNIRVLKALVK